MADRIQRNKDGTLDEVVVSDCLFHLEQMSKRRWWIGISRGRPSLHIWIEADKKGRLRVEVTEDGLGIPVEYDRPESRPAEDVLAELGL